MVSQSRAKSKKDSSAQQSAKVLIAAAAVSATLGGWAILSVTDAGASAVPGTDSALVAPQQPQTQQQTPSYGLLPGYGNTQNNGQVPGFRRNRRGSFVPNGSTVPSTQDPSAQVPSTQDPSTQMPMPFTRTHSSR